MSKAKTKLSSFENVAGEDIIVYLKTSSISQLEAKGQVSTGTAIRGFLVGYDDSFIYMSPRDENTFNIMISVSEIGVLRVVTGMADESDKIGYDGEEVH